MEDINITSEPVRLPAKKTPTRKRRKRRTTAQIARDNQKAAQVRHAPETLKPVNAEVSTQKDSLSQAEVKPPEPIGPSPAVLALQSQVVDLVNQRAASRQRLTQAHAAYLMAQGAFQAMQGELQGIEQEVQYRIQLIAQLENRQPSNVVNITGAPWDQQAVNAPNFGAIAGVSSEPSAPMQRQPGTNLQYATGSADDLRREMRGMM